MKYAYSLYKNSIRCAAQVVLQIFANKTADFANNHPNFKCKFSYAKIRTSAYSECCAFIIVSMSKLRNPTGEGARPGDNITRQHSQFTAPGQQVH